MPKFQLSAADYAGEFRYSGSPVLVNADGDRIVTADAYRVAIRFWTKGDTFTVQTVSQNGGILQVVFDAGQQDTQELLFKDWGPIIGQTWTVTDVIGGETVHWFAAQFVPRNEINVLRGLRNSRANVHRSPFGDRRGEFRGVRPSQR